MLVPELLSSLLLLLPGAEGDRDLRRPASDLRPAIAFGEVPHTGCAAQVLRIAGAHQHVDSLPQGVRVCAEAWRDTTGTDLLRARITFVNESSTTVTFWLGTCDVRIHLYRFSAASTRNRMTDPGTWAGDGREKVWSSAAADRICPLGLMDRRIPPGKCSVEHGWALRREIVDAGLAAGSYAVTVSAALRIQGPTGRQHSVETAEYFGGVVHIGADDLR